MLILTRNRGENIVINEDIYVKILGVKGHQVRIGIEAPKDVLVHREEIHLRIKEELERDLCPAQKRFFNPSNVLTKA